MPETRAVSAASAGWQSSAESTSKAAVFRNFRSGSRDGAGEFGGCCAPPESMTRKIANMKMKIIFKIVTPIYGPVSDPDHRRQ